MKTCKLIVATTLLGMHAIAQAATLADIPVLLLTLIGGGIYLNAYFVLAGSFLILAALLLVLLIQSRFVSANASDIRWWLAWIGPSIIFSLKMIAGSLLVILIGLGFGFNVPSIQELSALTGNGSGYQGQHKSKQEIKAENDAKPKVKDDLSWQKYSPLKRPWPEFEGALGVKDAPLIKSDKPTPAYAIEIFIGGPPRPKLVKLCELGYAAPCYGEVVYMLNTSNYTFSNLAEGRYALHMLNLQTGQAVASKPFRLDDQWHKQKRFDLTAIQLTEGAFFSEIPLEKF